LDRSAKQRLTEHTARQGIDTNRIVFLPSINKEQHMERLQKAHLYLDTTIYGAHTSAGDALWAGLPILTILGDTQAARVCASMINATGFYNEMVVSNLQEYEEKAVAWGLNPQKLKQLRTQIETVVADSPLFDTIGYVKNFEKALKETWRLYSVGEKPKSFAVTELEIEVEL